MMMDKITKLGNSSVQHGAYNARIYLMKLSQEDFPTIIPALDRLALDNSYTKIIIKVPAYAHSAFLLNGYSSEATIPKFYNGYEDAVFMGKYFSDQRATEIRATEIAHVLNTALAKSHDSIKRPLELDFSYRVCCPSDISSLVALYQKVFQTYPFPIFDPEYILHTMKNQVRYFGIWHLDDLVAVSSTEIDVSSSSVEMTDFATLPEYRSNGFSTFLLRKMEQAVREDGIKTAYSIARALSQGMNITFAKNGYIFGGTLINNTNISGSLESMNVWYKTYA